MVSKFQYANMIWLLRFFPMHNNALPIICNSSLSTCNRDINIDMEMYSYLFMNLHKLELYLGIFVSIHIYRILLTIRYKCFTFSYHALALTEVCINIEILKVEVKRFFPLSFDEKKNQSKSLWWMYFPLRQIAATLNF